VGSKARTASANKLCIYRKCVYALLLNTPNLVSIKSAFGQHEVESFNEKNIWADYEASYRDLLSSAGVYSKIK